MGTWCRPCAQPCVMLGLLLLGVARRRLELVPSTPWAETLQGPHGASQEPSATRSLLSHGVWDQRCSPGPCKLGVCPGPPTLPGGQRQHHPVSDPSRDAPVAPGGHLADQQDQDLVVTDVRAPAWRKGSVWTPHDPGHDHDLKTQWGDRDKAAT